MKRSTAHLYTLGRVCALCPNRIANKNKSGFCTGCWNIGRVNDVINSFLTIDRFYEAIAEYNRELSNVYVRPPDKPFIYKFAIPTIALGRSYWWRLECPRCSSKTIFETWQEAIDYVFNY